MPHFDRQGHYRTQESVERMRRRARNEEVEVGASGGVLGPFIAVTGVIGFVFAISAFFAPPTVSKREDGRRREGGGATT